MRSGRLASAWPRCRKRSRNVREELRAEDLSVRAQRVEEGEALACLDATARAFSRQDHLEHEASAVPAIEPFLDPQPIEDLG